MVEWEILTALWEWHSPARDFFFTHITMLGDGGVLWIALGLLLLLRKKYRKQGVLLLLCLLISFLIGNVFLKNLVQRSRPCWMYPNVPLLVANPRDFSFPSAHTMVGFAGATALWHTDRRFGVAAYVVAALIAFSRLYLTVHWPTDVLAGMALGIAVGYFVFYIARKREGEAAYEDV